MMNSDACYSKRQICPAITEGKTKTQLVCLSHTDHQIVIQHFSVMCNRAHHVQGASWLCKGDIWWCLFENIRTAIALALRAERPSSRLQQAKPAGGLIADFALRRHTPPYFGSRIHGVCVTATKMPSGLKKRDTICPHGSARAETRSL